MATATIAIATEAKTKAIATTEAVAAISVGKAMGGEALEPTAVVSH